MTTETDETLTCECGARLEYKGRGRKPTRCKACAARETRRRTAARQQRRRAHEQDRAVSRYGPLWLYHGRAVRRDPRHVWGATGERDQVRTHMGGVFHPIGAEGLPGEHNVLAERLRAGERSPELDEARAWLEAHPDWWRIEEHAHGVLTKAVVDSVVVHGETYAHPWATREPGYRERAGRVRLVFAVGPAGEARRLPADWADYERVIEHNNQGGRA